MTATELEVTELRKRITHLEGEVAFLYKHLNMTFEPEPELTDDPTIVEQLKKSNFLGAIAAYRRLHSEANVDDAKQAVQEIQGRLGL